jgi:hypothetical protein
MPTAHPRIQVTTDDELSRALDEARAILGPMPASALVRDLALRGAATLVGERAERSQLLQELAEASISSHPGFDRDVLDRIDELAWGFRDP